MEFDFDKLIDRRGSDCIKWDGVAEYLGAGDVLPMWVADMDFATPGFVVQALQQRLDHGIFAYHLRPEGYFTSLQNWLWRRHQWKVEKDWIIFCPGVVPALNLAVLAFTNPGDSVIVQPPVYFPFFNAVTDHSRQLVYNPLKIYNSRLCIDFDDLEAKAANGARMIILSNPHNPGGIVWTRDELLRLAEICLKNQVLILSDEIHCDLMLKPFKHTATASLSEEISEITITTTAPSKTFNLSGFSTSSVIISDPELRKRFSGKLEGLHLGLGNIFGNVASQAAYALGDDYVDKLMEYLAGNVALLEDFTNRYLPQIKLIRPEATFLAWLDCRSLGLNPNELNRFFLEKAKVGINEGSMFGPGGEGFVRLNFGCPRSTLLKGLEQIRQAVETM